MRTSGLLTLFFHDPYLHTCEHVKTPVENCNSYLPHAFLSACTGDYSLAKARGLSPRTGGQTVV